MSKTKNIALLIAAATQLACLLPGFAANPGNKTSELAEERISLVSSVNHGQLPIWSANIRVPYRSWLPREKPRQVLLCVHALGFSSKSFTAFGRIMARRGLAVYAVDVRGFGEWMNRKGAKTLNFEACLNDVEAALRTLRKAYPKVPIYLVGESMGGAIALRVISRYSPLVDGLIYSVSSSDRLAQVTSELIVGAHYLANKDKPMDIAPEIMDRITTEANLKDKWEAEPTNYMRISPRELREFSAFMKGNSDAAVLVDKQPVLMLAGFKDKLVKPEGTIEIFNELSTQDKLLMVVGDGEHLLLEENQFTKQMSQLIFDWIESSLPARKH